MFHVIATIPPYAGHIREITAHPRVTGLRFNTVMPVGEERSVILKNLLSVSEGKELWIDLKTRQLRITGFAYLPYAFVELSHRISVDLPAKIFFKDCISEIVEIVDGNKLILSDRPYRVVGSGEPVNILDPSLKIEGFLTEGDKAYISAATKLGCHNYMLSFFESYSDITEIKSMDSQACIIAKIESKQGFDFVKRGYHPGSGIRLMAARDDLFINLGYQSIHDALVQIVQKDNEAIVASKILTSLEDNQSVSLQDVSDLYWLKHAGYKNLMLSDGLCFRQDSFRKAMEVFGRLSL
jgi:hypothetical protein